MSAQPTSGRILRRCINCGASESQENPLANKLYEGITLFVCEDVAACARRYVAIQQDQENEFGGLSGSDPWKIEFKAGF